MGVEVVLSRCCSCVLSALSVLSSHHVKKQEGLMNASCICVVPLRVLQVAVNTV